MVFYLILLILFKSCLISDILADEPGDEYKLPYLLQVQPLFFHGGAYPGAPVDTPLGYAPTPLYNTSEPYRVPTNYTINIPGFSPFSVSNPYGYYMPPIVVVVRNNGTVYTSTTTQTTTLETTTKAPPTVTPLPGLGHRFFTRSKWRKSK